MRELKRYISELWAALSRSESDKMEVEESGNLEAHELQGSTERKS